MAFKFFWMRQSIFLNVAAIFFGCGKLILYHNQTFCCHNQTASLSQPSTLLIYVNKVNDCSEPFLLLSFILLYSAPKSGNNGVQFDPRGCLATPLKMRTQSATHGPNGRSLWNRSDSRSAQAAAQAAVTNSGLHGPLPYCYLAINYWGDFERGKRVRQQGYSCKPRLIRLQSLRTHVNMKPETNGHKQAMSSIFSRNCLSIVLHLALSSTL